MMKKIFFLLLAAFSLTACDKGGDDTPTITGYNPDQLNQTLYADQTSGAGNFAFTAAQSWTTQITDLTRTTESEVWITLDPSHGGAGTVNMKITLTPNLTGKDRTATITIVCGGMTITITVEQKGTTEGGNTPDPNAKQITRIDVEDYYINDLSGTEYMTFRYDEDMLVEMITTETESYKGTLRHTWVTTTSIEEVTSVGSPTIRFSIKERKDGQSPKQLVDGAARLENGRVISCSRTGIDNEKDDAGRAWSDRFTLSYDALGYLSGCMRIEPENTSEDNFYSTWLGGNYTKVVWGGRSGIDEAVYGNAAYKNKANLDLNAYIVLNSEGFDFSFGEPDKILALCGYTGKRSANLATKVTEKWNDQARQTITFTYEFDADGYPTIIRAHYPPVIPPHYLSDNSVTTYKITYNK